MSIKIPPDIKKAIKNAYKYSCLANENNDVVRSWLKQNNLYNGVNIDPFIDVCELGLGEPKDFINYISNPLKIGNEEL